MAQKRVANRAVAIATLWETFPHTCGCSAATRGSLKVAAVSTTLFMAETFLLLSELTLHKLEVSSDNEMELVAVMQKVVEAAARLLLGCRTPSGMWGYHGILTVP